MARLFSRLNLFFKQVIDILISDLTFATSYKIKWFYRFNIKNQITEFKLQKNSNYQTHTGFLYLHEDKDSEIRDETSAVLLLHGLYGHPYTLLHLADVAQKANLGPVFSVHLHYNEYDPEIHRDLLKQAIEKIEEVIKERGGKLKGLVTTGHSLGAIESAYLAFVEKDDRIRSVISIAGRLRVVHSEDKACQEHLKPTVEIVYKGIQDLPDFPLYQIVAGDDWNAPLEATAVRPDKEYCYIVENALHLNVLYYPETIEKFEEFLKKSL